MNLVAQTKIHQQRKSLGNLRGKHEFTTLLCAHIHYCKIYSTTKKMRQCFTTQTIISKITQFWPSDISVIFQVGSDPKTIGITANPDLTCRSILEHFWKLQLIFFRFFLFLPAITKCHNGWIMILLRVVYRVNKCVCKIIFDRRSNSIHYVHSCQGTRDIWHVATTKYLEFPDKK